MANLKGSKTHENLKAAFAGESQANRRYLYFAKQADVEGRPDIAGLFRDTAEGETGHAHGHLEYLEEVGDPATGEPIGDTEKNLAAAVAGWRRPRSRTPAGSQRACSRSSRSSAIRTCEGGGASRREGAPPRLARGTRR
jgi:rubrerythrin